MRPDVIVVGLGAMGAAATYQLASRGVRVLGLDRFAPPHDRGSHAGGSRVFRMTYAEGDAYVPLLRRALELWRAVEEAGDVSLLTATGGLMLGQPESAEVDGALASARRHGLAYDMLDAHGIRRRFPAFTPADGEVGVYDPAAGVLRPEASVATYLRLAHQAGGSLSYGVRVTGWRATADGVSVATPDGELTAARLVVCPGGWAPQLLADLRVPLRVERRVQHYWSPPGADFAAARCPVWIWESAPGIVAYGIPTLDGPGPNGSAPHDAAADAGAASDMDVTKAAFHHGDDPADAEEGAGPVRMDEEHAIVDWLAGRLPALAASRWLGGRPCVYTLTPDEHFLLGIHPERDAVAVAGGFSGHGFKFAPVVGEILADLAQHGATRHPIEFFAVDRFRR